MQSRSFTVIVVQQPAEPALASDRLPLDLRNFRRRVFARDLYATPAYLLRRVTLPLLSPGIVAGAMLAFPLSLDDFVISFFTAGPESTTLPLYLYASLRRGITPELHALSTLIVLATVCLVVALESLTRYRKE